MTADAVSVENQVLRLQRAMLAALAIAWLGMLGQALGAWLDVPILDDAGLFVALAGLLVLIGAWLRASMLTGNSRDMLLTSVEDEYARHIRARALRAGFGTVMLYLFAAYLLADAQVVDFGVSHTARLGFFLGLTSSLAVFVWSQRR